MVPDPDAVSLLGPGELLLCSAGVAPAPHFSPLSGDAQTSEEEPNRGAGVGLHQRVLGSEKDLRCL